MVDISICFGTANRLELLQCCIDSIRVAVEDLSYEIVITDGGSTDGTLEYLRFQPDVDLIEHGEMRGAVAAYRDAVDSACGEYVCYLSDDLVVPGGVFKAAIAYLNKNPKCGVVGLPYQSPGSNVDTICYANVNDKRLPFASFGVLRRSVGEAADWFPTCNYHYYLDVNICLSVQCIGYTIDPLPGAYVIEHFLAPNITRGETKNNGYSKKHDAEAFHEYWRGKI